MNNLTEQIIQPLMFSSNANYTVSNHNTIRNYYNVSPLLINKDQFIKFTLIRLKSSLDLTEYNSKWPITEVNIINVVTGRVENLVSKFAFTIGNSPYEEGVLKEHINYLGNCNALGLRQGQYKLQVKDAYSHQGYNANTWTSETFRIGFPIAGRNVKFEYWLPYSFNDLYFYPYYLNGNRVYYEIPLQSAISYGDGTFDIFQESAQNKHSLNEYGYQRFAEIKSCMVLGDTNTIKNLQQLRLISNVNGSEVFFTNETGERKQIQIFDVVSDPMESSNYLKITVKYKVKDSDIRINDKQVINLSFTQAPGVTPELEEIQPGFKFGGHPFKFGDKIITP